jgi:hypothetical protein
MRGFNSALASHLYHNYALPPLREHMCKARAKYDAPYDLCGIV